jgi:glyoxylase-like metal-dependent hydrolase (beta-lactamase superfamily II)
MEIAAHVHWIKTSSSNVYLCVDPDGLTLVDTGMPKQTEAILSYVRQIGRQPADIRRILITHADIDHAGSVAALQEVTGATVYASAETAALLREGKSPQHLPWFAQFIVNRFMRYRPVTAQLISEGETLDVLGGLQTVASPGHTLDHHAFFSPSTGVLFTGDAFNTNNNRLQLTPKPITADLPTARRTAHRLLDLKPTFFACGHGTPLKQPDTGPLMQELTV